MAQEELAPMQHESMPLRNADGDVVAWVILDPEDAERFGRWRWQLQTTGYAVRTCKHRGRLYLHREILGLTKGDGLMADHINRERLDCRRSNLRVVTAAQNNHNKRTWSASGIRGVSWHKLTRKWRVHVTVGGKYHHGGMFTEIEDAEARAVEMRKHLLSHTIDDQRA